MVTGIAKGLPAAGSGCAFLKKAQTFNITAFIAPFVARLHRWACMVFTIMAKAKVQGLPFDPAKVFSIARSDQRFPPTATVTGHSQART